MKIYFIGALILTLCLGAFAAPGQAEDIAVVRAQGLAVKTADMSAVKKKALDRALKDAVEKALEPLVRREFIESTPGLAVLVDKAIYSKADAYVLNYKVIAEGWMTHMDLTTVPAADLEQDDPEAGAGGTEGDPGAEENWDQNSSETDMQAWVEAYHIMVEASIDMVSLQRAVNRIAPDGGRSSSQVTITILDVNRYNTYRKLYRSIKRLPGVEDLSYSTFYRGRIVMKAATALPTQALIDKISRKAGKRFAVRPGGLKAIIIKPARKKKK